MKKAFGLIVMGLIIWGCNQGGGSSGVGANQALGVDTNNDERLYGTWVLGTLEGQKELTRFFDIKKGGSLTTSLECQLGNEQKKVRVTVPVHISTRTILVLQTQSESVPLGETDLCSIKVKNGQEFPYKIFSKTKLLIKITPTEEYLPFDKY